MPIGTTSPAVNIQSQLSSEVLSPSSDLTFALNGATPAPFGFWRMTFSPHVLGPQEQVFTFGTIFGGGVCPPNTFVARGVGVP